MGRSGPSSSRIGTTTTLLEIADDDGSFCAVLGEGVPVFVALGLGLALVADGLAVGVGDAADEPAGVKKGLGEAAAPG
jgi:hypothetical protein